ncbi:hypothetical protein AB0C77_35405 [Streptomyces sp. NPDC048629]|uniref:hypothetical protein n=1 Tax=Streptomyces sp. NPDC048629 TaxID=3154824 RepID=UPI00341A84D0
MKAWGYWGISVTAVLLLGVGGCIAALNEQPEKIERTRIAGTWTGEGGARVELHANGRFEMSGIPRTAVVFGFTDPPPGDGKLSGSGTWEPVGDRDEVDEIDLSIDAGGSFEDKEFGSLEVAQSGDKPVLYFATDSDRWFGFEIRKTTK